MSDEQALKRAAEILRETASRSWDIFIASAAPARHDEYLALAAKLEALAAPADSTVPRERTKLIKLIGAVDLFLDGKIMFAELTQASTDATHELYADALAAPAPPLSAQPAEPKHGDLDNVIAKVRLVDPDLAARAEKLFAAPPAAEPKQGPGSSEPNLDNVSDGRPWYADGDKPEPKQEERSAAFRHAINCNSMENGSNTPDFILAKFLSTCLEAWEAATLERENWYGKPMSIAAPPAAEPKKTGDAMTPTSVQLRRRKALLQEIDQFAVEHEAYPVINGPAVTFVLKLESYQELVADLSAEPER